MPASTGEQPGDTGTVEAQVKTEAQPAVKTPESKMVPEAELLAAKKGLEAKLEELTAANKKLQDQLGSSQAASQAVGELQSKVDSLTKELESAKTSGTQSQAQMQQMQTKLLDTRKQLFVTKFGLSADQVKGLTEAQLDGLEAVLPGLNLAPRKNGFDSGSGGNGSQVTGSGRELIRAGLSS